MLGMTAPAGRSERRWRRYVALGDSFTEGVGDPWPDGSLRGWADRLAVALAEQAPDLLYANLAIRGRRFNRVVAEQVPAALQMEPDLVSFAAGGNDLLRPGFELRPMIERFDDAVAGFRAAGADVIVFRFADLSRRLPLRRVVHARVLAMNEAVVEVGERHGAYVVDMFNDTILDEAGAWADDRLHLSGLGHGRVASLVLGRLGLPAAPVTEPDAESPRLSWLSARRADLRWVYAYLAPWLHRRLTGRSSGDRRDPKRPVLTPVTDSAR
jgi:lysophospholipase L1-like esterase